MLPRHARCVLSRLRCNGHSLLLCSYLSRIGRIENSSCNACGPRPRTSLISFCTVQLRTLCVAHSSATLCLYDFWTRLWGVARLLGLHGLSPCPHPSEGVGSQQIFEVSLQLLKLCSVFLLGGLLLKQMVIFSCYAIRSGCLNKKRKSRSKMVS